MKKILMVLLCFCLLLCACKKKEENETGDIKYTKNVEALTDAVSYDINNYHLDIRSSYEGMAYKDSLFAYMINDTNGMFIVDYVDVNNKDIDKELLNEYHDVDKDYLYERNDDVINIYYYIDDEYYLYISIENLNTELDDNDLYYLFNQLDFDVQVK